MTLNDLALKFGTDKSSEGHNYCPFYEQTLPKNPKRLLEIGCLYGASARMWREWFPQTEVHVLDLFEENTIPDIPGVVFHKGDQRDWRILDQLRKFNFDVVIDDGSHNSRDQMMTFYGLFNGGHYYIEDIHCADEPFYRDGLPLGVTAKKIFSENDFRFEATYAYETPIVLLKQSSLCC
jgi:hypothetical protein